MDSKRIKRLHKEYRKVTTNNEIIGKIHDLHIEKGACFVTMDSNKIFFNNSANHLYSEEYLSHLLSIDDSIVKKAGSDTLRVYKNNSNYYFLLGKFINNPHK